MRSVQGACSFTWLMSDLCSKIEAYAVCRVLVPWHDFCQIFTTYHCAACWWLLAPYLWCCRRNTEGVFSMITPQDKVSALLFYFPGWCWISQSCYWRRFSRHATCPGGSLKNINHCIVMSDCQFVNKTSTLINNFWSSQCKDFMKASISNQVVQ